MIERVTDETSDEYENFVKNHYKGHIMQSLLWSKVKKNWKFCAFVKRDDHTKIIGSIAVILRKLPFLNYYIAYAPRGPVCDVTSSQVIKDLLQAALNFCKLEKCITLIIDPDIEKNFQCFSQVADNLGFKIERGDKDIQPERVFRLDIKGKNEDQLINSFKSKTRYNIRLALKKDIKVIIDDFSAFDEFYRLLQRTSKRNNFQIRSKEYIKNLIVSLNENARLYLAYYDQKMIAGTVALHYGDKVWYLYGAFDYKYKNMMPNYLLQWEMIKWGLAEKCSVYDFRGISADRNSTVPHSGLYRFKEGFCASLIEFTGQYHFDFHPYLYNIFSVSLKVNRFIKLFSMK